MKKRILAIALCSALTAGLAACGTTTANTETTTETETTAAETEEETEAAEETEEETEAQEETEAEVTGGWTVTEAEQAGMDDETQAIFDEAAAQWDGGELRPIAVLGTQVVAGTNYCFLAESTLGDPLWQLVYVYHDLDGENTLSNVVTLDLSADSFGEASDEQLEGGWYVPSDTCARPGKDIVELFDKSNDSEYILIAPLATQVVAGTNYLMLCEDEVSGDENHQLFIATVYEDLDENVSMSNIVPFSVAEFNEQ